MRSTVSIAFGADEVVINLPAGGAALDSLDARRWLDEQFTAYDCEPLRASGKVLTADKVLAVANAIGKRGFEQDEALRLAYARAAVAALARDVVRVDVDGRAVTY
jgi:hypothetical protein